MSLRRLLCCLLIAAAAAWVGGNAALVLGTNSLFGPLKEALGEDIGRNLAGTVFGGWLAAWSLVTWGLCGLVVLLGLVLSVLAWAWGRRIGPVVIGILLLAALGARAGGHFLIDRVGTLGEAIAEARAEGDHQRLEEVDAEHDRAHALATRLYAGETAIALLLAILHTFALARRGGPCDV